MSKQSFQISLLKISIDRRNTTPLYQQLYDSLRQQIIDGILRKGQRLPASRTFSLELGISRNVIAKAFDHLISEGYITGKVGSGTYVSSVLPESYLQSKGIIHQEKSLEISGLEGLPSFTLPDLEGKDVAGMKLPPFVESAALDLFPYKSWHSLANAAYKEFARQNSMPEDAKGLASLRQILANFLRYTRGVRCEADQILITSGIQQALILSAYALLRHRKSAWMEDPGCPVARNAFAAFDATIYPVPVHEDGLDLEFGEKNYPAPDLIYVSPAHQYPLGGSLSAAKREALFEWAKRENVWIIEDDANGLLRYEGRPAPALQGDDLAGRVIHLGSFNHVLPSSMSMAYMVLPNEKIAGQFATLKSVFDRQSRFVDQCILSRFMSSGQFERHLRQMRIVYKDRQDVMLAAASRELKGKIVVEEQPAGLHLLGWLSEDKSDIEISQKLKSKGIVATALSDYTIHFKRRPALLLAYAGFHKFRIAHYLQRMNQIL
jgi:GntR family transcriptional regulator / MocR family aminotransferase